MHYPIRLGLISQLHHPDKAVQQYIDARYDSTSHQLNAKIATMSTSYYYAAHFNMPETHHEPAILKLRAPTLAQHHAHMKDETPSQNVYMCAAQHLAKYGHIDYQDSSLFFRLPAELRNKVYNELLCPSAPNSKDLSQHASHATKPAQLYPAILASCKRIHDEAADLLYKNIFHAHPSLLTSLPHLSSAANPVVDKSSIAKIKRWQLSIRLDTDPRFDVAQATAAFSGAEYLEIRVWQSMFDGADSSVLQLFTGIRGVKVARVIGCADAALARWLEGSMMQAPEQEDCVMSEPGRDWFGGKDVWTFGNR